MRGFLVEDATVQETALVSNLEHPVTGGPHRTPEADPPGPMQRWFAPLANAGILRSLGYLLWGAVLGWVWFGLVVAALAASLMLVVVVVGVPLTVAAFALVSWLARAECRRSALVGVPIVQRQPEPGRGMWSRFVTTLGDPVRWRQVAYLLLAPLLSSLALAAYVFCWMIPIGLVTITVGSDPDQGWLELLLGTIAGVFLLPAAARASVALGRGMALFARLMLGRDPGADATRRIEELTASRAEILEAVAEERRRIERNLHDGVQARLVALGIDLGMAEYKVRDDPDAAAELLADARDKTRAAIGELRAIGRGMHPAVLGDRGLDAALSAVVASGPLPVTLRCEVPVDLPIESAEIAYFVVSEAVANVMKHADARTATVSVIQHDEHLDIEVFDDGRGGAMASSGGGLAGVAARVRGVEGSVELDSPAGGPTLLRARVPVAAS